MKILAFTPVWKRPKTTRLCFEGFKELKNFLDLEVFCVVSEKWAVKLCEEFGFKHAWSNNDPLGQKLNNGLEEAIKEDFDYLMTSGSDNLYHKDLFKIYEPYFKEKMDVFGVNKCVFVEGNKAKLVDYKGTILGAGRMIRKQALVDVSKRQLVEFHTSCSGIYSFTSNHYYWLHVKQVKDMRAHLEIKSEIKVKFWSDEKNSALTHDTNTKLFMLGCTNKEINTGEIGYVIDLKGKDNIWKYEDFEGTHLDYEKIKDRFCLLGEKISV